MRLQLWRCLAFAALMATFALAPAVPAQAHSVAGAEPTNYRSTLRNVSPAIKGVDLSIREAGNRVQLVNTTDIEILVKGYEGEPYLRVGPDGTFANKASPAFYLNQSATYGTPVPPEADVKAPPRWERQSDSDTAIWHDHRVHWASTEDPPQVRKAPSVDHVIDPRWTIEMMHGATPVVATGDLVWRAPPASYPWWLLAGAAAAVATAVSIRSSARKSVVVVVAALIGADIVHTVALAMDIAGDRSTRWPAVALNALPFVVAWGAAVAGAVMVIRRRVSSWWFLLFAGLVMALLGAGGDLAVWTHSTLPSGLPAVVTKGAVSLTLGLGLAVSATAGLRLRRQAREPVADLD